MATPVPAALRRLDPVAVEAALRRLLRRPQAPWLHAEVARRMAERLAVIRLKPRLVIDWWSGLGAGAEALAAAYPKARRVGVEPNAEWLERTQAAAHRPWWSAGRWGAAPAQTVLEDDEIAGGAELVWANMMLHAAFDPPALFERWHGLLAVDGFVMFSCLGPGTLRELRALYQAQGWPAPTPGFVDMHDLGDMLLHAGFADPVMDQETLTLQWNTADALLEELRSLGGNTAPERLPGLRTPRWRRRLLDALAGLAGPDGKISMSFEVAYGHAFKAAPRVRTDAVTTVSLETMRAMVRSVVRPRPGRD